jgi:predicted DNA-binding protein
MIMNRVQKLADQVLRRQEESIRFSVTLTNTDNSRLESLAELMGRSKSAFCSDLIVAALDDMEEMFDTPDTNSDSALPSVKEYTEAFKAIKGKLTEGHRAMLVAHYHAPKYTTTTPDLAKSAGYASFGGVNLQYKRIGEMLAGHLNWPLPQHSNGAPFPTAFLVEWNQEQKSKIWYCTLHPQVAKALEAVGLIEN